MTHEELEAYRTRAYHASEGSAYREDLLALLSEVERLQIENNDLRASIFVEDSIRVLKNKKK